MKAQVLFVAPFKKLADDARLVIEEKFAVEKIYLRLLKPI